MIKRLLTFTSSESSFEEAEKSINLTSAVIWISTAWKNVSRTIISKCFSKAGFLETIYLEDKENLEEDVPLAQPFPQLQVMQGVSFNKYVSIDSDILPENSNLSISAIVSEIVESDSKSDSEQEEDFEANDSNVTDFNHVCKNLRDVQKFLIHRNHNEMALEITKILTKCESTMMEEKLNKLKQTSIKQYFKKI